ncbi:hypothetical protein F5887DRAFT_891420, partial [Amanita rubescens]
SIYPQPESETILLDTPSPLEHQIGQARRKITETIRQVGQGIVNKWIGVEQAVEKRVKSIVSPNEQITAGLLYTGIATLTDRDGHGCGRLPSIVDINPNTKSLSTYKSAQRCRYYKTTHVLRGF